MILTAGLRWYQFIPPFICGAIWWIVTTFVVSYFKKKIKKKQIRQKVLASRSETLDAIELIQRGIVDRKAFEVLNHWLKLRNRKALVNELKFKVESISQNKELVDSSLEIFENVLKVLKDEVYSNRKKLANIDFEPIFKSHNASILYFKGMPHVIQVLKEEISEDNPTYNLNKVGLKILLDALSAIQSFELQITQILLNKAI